MNREEAIKVLDMFLFKQCDLGRTSRYYDENTVWEAVCLARDYLAKEQESETNRCRRHSRNGNGKM